VYILSYLLIWVVSLLRRRGRGLMGEGALLVPLKIFGSSKRDRKIHVHIGDSEAMTVHTPAHFDESIDITSHRLA